MAPTPECVVLGLDASGQVIQLSDLSHPEACAVLEWQGESWTLRDLGGPTPVFADGRPVSGRVSVTSGVTITVGSGSWAVPPAMNLGPLAAAPREHRGLSIELEGVAYRVPDGAGAGVRTLLSEVSLQIAAGEFVGILGPSGAGKSTLLKLMNGDLAPAEGGVWIDGLPVPEFLRHSRTELAYLPQELILHDLLTPAEALGYLGRLQGIPGDLKSLVRRTLELVGVDHRADTPIRNLSGGEKKRVALAGVLLAEPTALFLDEATSGLDPAREREMMELFRAVADAGKTVVCITHFPQNVGLCDRLLVVHLGRLVFDGRPEQLLVHFNVQRVDDIYTRFTGESLPPAPRVVEGRGRRSAAALMERQHVPVRMEVQTKVLLERYWRLLLADRRNLWLMLGQAPVIALLIGATFGNIAVSYTEQHTADWKQVAFLLTMSVLWCAATNGVREIVKERAIFAHECRIGLDARAYYISKLVPLGGFAILQSLLLLVILGKITDLAGNWLAHGFILGLLALTGTALGLLLSASAKTSERAMTLLPIILIGEAVFSSGLARMTGMVKGAAMLFVSAYWSLAGLKATLPTRMVESTFASAPGEYQPPILGGEGSLMCSSLAFLLHLAVLAALSVTVLRRRAVRSSLR